MEAKVITRAKLWIIVALTVLVCVSCSSPLTGNEEGETGSVVIRIYAAPNRAVAITDPPNEFNIGQIEHTAILTKVNLVDGEYAPLEEPTEYPISASGMTTISGLPLNAFYSIDVKGTWYGIDYSWSTATLIVQIRGPNTGTAPIQMEVSSDFAPYLGYTAPITGAEDLTKIGKPGETDYPLDGKYLLTDDLSLSGEWTPIGDAANPFTGTFDGNGYTISGLTINAAAGDNQGLFGVIGVGSDGTVGTVKNLKLEAANINAPASNNVAAIAGTVGAGAAIENCSVSGTIKGTDNIGAIAGNNNGKVSNCYAAGIVESDVAVASSNAGGITGVNSGVVEYCFSSNTVHARNLQTGPNAGTHTGAGGIAGMSHGRIANCYSTGDVTSESSNTDTHSGGIAGAISGGARVEYCYATGTVTAIETGNSWGGGIVGWIFSPTAPVSVEYCVALNPNLNLTGSNTTWAIHPARIANEATPLPPPATLSNNYARADMMFNNAVNTWLTGSVNDPQNFNGADIITADYNGDPLNWWLSTSGFDPAVWDFMHLDGNKMPILNQDFFPAGAQTAPVVVLP